MLSFIGNNFMLLAFGVLLVFAVVLGGVSIADAFHRPPSG